MKRPSMYLLSKFLTILVYFILTIWAILCLFPLYWMIKNGFEPNKLIGLWPPAVLPMWDRLTLENYRSIMVKFPMARWFTNSLVMSVVRTLGSLFFGTMAGYAFAKLKFWGNRTLFWMLLPVLMIPGLVLILPQYQLIRSFGWIDTYAALLIPGLTGGVWAMFLMRQFMHSIPIELIESSRIDGASEFGIFLRIVIPLAMPGMAVLGIFSFIGNWNSFLYPLVVTTEKMMRTLPVGLSMLRSSLESGPQQMGEIMAGATIAAVPMILIFLFSGRFFLKGITVGALKG